MPYAGEPIEYHYRFFSLPGKYSSWDIMYIKPTEADMALIEYDRSLWGNLIKKVVAENGHPNSLGILRVHDESYSASTGMAYKYFLKNLEEYPINENSSEWSFGAVEHIYDNA